LDTFGHLPFELRLLLIRNVTLILAYSFISDFGVIDIIKTKLFPYCCNSVLLVFLRLGAYSAKAEVTYLDIALSIDEYVIRFEVTVNDVGRVQIVDCLQQIIEDNNDMSLCNSRTPLNRIQK